MGVPQLCKCAVLAACLLHLAVGEMFTALVELERVLHTEHDVAQDLRSYVAQEELRLQKIRDIANDYEEHSRIALVDPASHLANPVNAFLVVKRFTADWYKVEDLVKENHAQDFLRNISLKTASFPTDEDLNGAAVALLRLQDTYALPTANLAQGKIKGVKQSPIMAAEDCYELGRQAYNQGDHYHSILWMQQALETLLHGPPVEEGEKEIDQAVLLDYLSYSVYMQGNTQHALNLTIDWLKLEPDHQRAQNNKRYYEQMIAEDAAQKGEAGPSVPEFKNERPIDSYRGSHEFTSYESLCRGENTVEVKDAHQLTCQFKRHHPAFYIRPLKEETMHMDPWIAIYHDVLTDSEVAKIKELAAPRLQRSGVFTYSENDSSYTRYRTSKSAWLNDYEDDKIKQVSLRSGALSNLTLETVEQLQVVNYGIGGHYEPHYDFARENEKNTFDAWRGNRILTVIFYMSDVEAGGATVFPELGVKLWPEKGACAVWYNLKPDGSGDYLTRHAACPVLTGSKWVCNKWFHERGQEFNRPCGLAPDS